MNVKIDKGMTKEIMIDGVPVLFRADASIPRLYRIHFGRDVFADMEKLIKQAALDKSAEEIAKQNLEELEKDIDISKMNTEALENIAYIMAYHADRENTADNIEDWLAQFGIMSLVGVLPQILELWGINTQSTSDVKKKKDPLTEK